MGIFDRRHPADAHVKTTVRRDDAPVRQVRRNAPREDLRYSRGSHSAASYRARGRGRSARRARGYVIMAVAVLVIAAITFSLLSCLG